MKFLKPSINQLTENQKPFNTPNTIDEIEEISNSLDDNLNQEIKVPIDVLDSFKIKDTLNTELWPNENLDPKIQKQLLKIANGFIKDIELPKGTKIKDIIFTGSLANFNWSKFSDIDIHVVINFNQFQAEPILIQGYFNSQKTLWNQEHDIKLFDYPVEMYVQDTNQKLTATAVYSIINNKWVKKPKAKAFQLDKKNVKNKAEKFIGFLKDIRDDYQNKQFQTVVDKSKKLKDKIKQMRKAGLENGGEFSLENIVFKTLRRTPFMEILDSFNVKAYDALMSVDENIENLNESQNINNFNFIEKQDEDVFSITAIHNGKELGHFTADIMTNAYWYFSDDMPEEDYDDIFIDDQFVRINHIKINPEARRKGLGKELMRRGINKIKRLGLDMIYLNASPTDSSGLPLNELVSFYESFGFKTLINQGNNVQMILDLNQGINEGTKYLPYDEKPEIKAASGYSSLSEPNRKTDLNKINFRINKATQIAGEFKSKFPDDNYFTIPTEGDGFYQVEFRHDGQIKTKSIRSSGDMNQMNGPFQPSDVGTCKTFQNVARYCFVKAGKNGKAIGASPAEDAANKALVIFRQEILDFLGANSYQDGNAPEISQANMNDKMKSHKQKKDLETKLRRRVSDTEWQTFLNTGQEPQPKAAISMDPQNQSDFEKRQDILRAKINARRRI